MKVSQKTVAQIVSMFLNEHPECLDPDSISGNCRISSQQFMWMLEDYGFNPTLIHLMDYLGEPFPKIHSIWDDAEFLVHYVVEVEGKTYDFTHRQFNPDSPVPVISTLQELMVDWDTVSEETVSLVRKDKSHGTHLSSC